MKTLRHILTYKQSEKWLYDVVESHSGKSNWIKDILSAYVKGELVYANKKDKPTISENEFESMFK